MNEKRFLVIIQGYEGIEHLYGPFTGEEAETIAMDLITRKTKEATAIMEIPAMTPEEIAEEAKEMCDFRNKYHFTNPEGKPLSYEKTKAYFELQYGTPTLIHEPRFVYILEPDESGSEYPPGFTDCTHKFPNFVAQQEHQQNWYEHEEIRKHPSDD
jgi:hypothetical protein